MPALLHIVLLKPRPDAEQDAIDRLDAALAGLRAEISGINAYRWGVNVSPEGLGRGYETGFVMEFENAAARDAYLPHPAHRAVQPLVSAVAAEVLVFDLEVGDGLAR